MLIFVIFGLVASIFQLVILREFSFSIAKNELTFIIAAGFWIIFCSLGSIVRLPNKLKELVQPIVASLFFFSSIVLIHTIKSFTGLHYYETASLGFVFILSIVLIGPPAFIIGNIFRNLVMEYFKENPQEKNIYAKFFAFEAIGFFLGGIAFTFYLSSYTNPLVFSPLAALLALRGKNKYRKLAILVIAGLTAVSSFKMFSHIRNREFNGEKITLKLGSRYGPILLIDKAGTENIFSEGSLLASSEDKATAEEFIHTSLSALSASNNKKILFIGAALSGQIEEIIKYDPESLDCIQINPQITKLAENKLHKTIKDRVNFITDDPRLYLKKTKSSYDAILMNMPAPVSLSLNRYFTEEFFKLINLRLEPQGIFSFSIPSKREILSPQFAKFNSSIVNSVGKIFKNKVIIPSGSMIIIASKGEKIQEPDLLKNFSTVNPKTEFFTIYHFKDSLNSSILNYIKKSLDRKTGANTDLNPTGLLNYLILEQNKFYPDLKIDFIKIRKFIIIMLLFLTVFITIISLLSKKLGSILNAGVIGFTSISMNSVIFILFQAYCGGLFWKLGLLIALFMAGLSIGALLMNRLSAYHSRLLPVIYLGWTIAILSLYSNLKLTGGSNYADIIFYTYTLICGLLTGSSYPILAESFKENRFIDKNIATSIYSADLAGAFLGTLFCGIVLIPFLGINGSLISLIILNIAFSLKNLFY